MATEFPFNHYTNLYVLHDFFEIAYIVCTHVPPVNSDQPSVVSSSDAVLARLRTAEKQFRQAAILVALDADKLELFTFYKKVDVVNEQRSILNKFGNVCRLNSCTVARKSAARVLDLLKPDSSRIYQLFTSAIISSVHLYPTAVDDAVHIGPTKYLIPEASSQNVSDPGGVPLCQKWHLKQLDLQVIASGQVILIVREARSGQLLRCSELLRYDERRPTLLGNHVHLYLAPTGQLARCSGTWQGNSIDLEYDLANSNKPEQSIYVKRRLSMDMVSQWLKQRKEALPDLNENTMWLEVDIPIIATTSIIQAPRTISWKQVLWPATLAFAFEGALSSSKAPEFDMKGVDALSFVQDWYKASAERMSLISNPTTTSNGKEEMVEEEALFSDEITFGPHEPAQLFGPPACPPSQMIYPTPPDGTTHPTPGMSSVDGFAPTPMQGSQAMNIAVEIGGEVDMQDAPAHDQPDNENYNEDLFDENSDDNVNSEPNWDFFDAPGFHAQVPQDAGRRSNGIVGDTTQQVDDKITSQAQPTPVKEDKAVNVSLRSPDLQKHEKQTDSPASPHDIRAPTDDIAKLTPAHFSPVAVKFEGAAEHKLEDMPAPSQQVAFEAASDGKNQSSRRSSIFEGTIVPLKTSDYDSKYGTKGKYWFDPVSTSNGDASLVNPVSYHRPGSSSSDTSMSSFESNSSDDWFSRKQYGNSPGQAWTQYESKSNETTELNPQANVDEVLELDISSVLNAVESASGREPFVLDVNRKVPVPGAPDMDQSTAVMVAQILVDQVSQSSFLWHHRGILAQHRTGRESYTLSIDHGVIKNPLSNATVSDLASLQLAAAAAAATRKPNEKGGKLEKPRIVVHRGEDEIQADTTLLAFWDVLGLQPVDGPKDITSFCLFPGGSSIADACSIFLHRIADTYSSCNFGVHTIGKVAGLSNNGLLAWPLDDDRLFGLKVVCQRLGTAIASAPNIDGTVVIYMISPATEASCYRDLCHAFTILFDCFSKALYRQNRKIELALQLVPLNFVVSPETVIVPPQKRYRELATEVYNRLPPGSNVERPATCGSAVMLEQLPHKSIEFDLNATIADPLSREGVCLHLAYSYSPDMHWLVAAWTDDRGQIALTMSYNMRARDGGERPRIEVLRDLWDISCDIMSPRTARWRLAIVKASFIAFEELNEWIQLVDQSSAERKAMIKVVWMSVTLEPMISLQVQDPGKINVTTSTTNNPNSAATPVSTPQNSTSPDHGVGTMPTPGGLSHANAATPPEHSFDAALDTEITLVDPLEDSWWTTLGFGLNQSDDHSIVRPAAASGLLIKRNGAKDESNSTTHIEVHLLTTSRSASLQAEKEGILQDMLNHFRRLVVLAATRGCIDTDRECIPWHIATAVKGANVLGEVM